MTSRMGGVAATSHASTMPVHDVRARIGFDAKFAPRILHRDERAKVVLVCLEPGQRIPPHEEDNEAFFYVLEGEGVLSSHEGDVPLSQGQLATVAFGGLRGLRAESSRFVVLATAVSGTRAE
jgi:quercetin dioxygenase-like cupin family protein